MLVTLESLINDNINTNDEVIDVESLEFDIVDTMMECSNIENEICTYENALSISNTLQMEDQKDTIFKRLIDGIKKLFERIRDFILRIFKRASDKAKQNQYDKVLSQLKERDITAIEVDLNKLGVEFFNAHTTGKHFKDLIDVITDYTNSNTKLLKELNQRMNSNITFDPILDEFNDISNSLPNKLENNPIIEVMKKFNDHNADSAQPLSFKFSRYASDKTRCVLSKDQLIKYVEWIKDISTSYDDVYNIQKSVDDCYKEFNNIVKLHADKNTEYIKMTRNVLHQVMGTIQNIHTSTFYIKETYNELIGMLELNNK